MNIKIDFILTNYGNAVDRKYSNIVGGNTIGILVGTIVGSLLSVGLVVVVIVLVVK